MLPMMKHAKIKDARVQRKGFRVILTELVVAIGGNGGDSHLGHSRLVLLHEFIHVLLVLLQAALHLILLSLQTAQLLLQLWRWTGQRTKIGDRFMPKGSR